MTTPASAPEPNGSAGPTPAAPVNAATARTTRPPAPSWSDHRIEVMLAKVLRFGVIASSAVVLCGAVIYLAFHGAQPANYRVFQGEPSDFRTIPGIFHAALHARGRGLIQLGLLLLISTPITRVLFSVAGFLLEHDRLYVICTVIVLAVLLYSLLGSGLLL